MKYNRAFILLNRWTHDLINEVLKYSSDPDLEQWIRHSKESFRGEHDDHYFYFKDSRIERGFKLPLEGVTLEFTDEELEHAS